MVKRIRENLETRKPGIFFRESFCSALIPSWFPGFQIYPLFLFSKPVVGSARWQMIAGEQQCSPEESPNTIRQHAAENTRAAPTQVGVDGKCHRKDTAGSLATKRR